MKTSLLFLVFSLSFFSCKEYETPEENDAMMVMAAPSSPSSDKMSYLVEPSDAEIEKKVIKNAVLRFETNDLDKTNNEIQEAVKKYNASLEKSTEGKTDFSIYRKLTIRIPNQNFENFIATVGKGVSFFDEKEITATDVTTEFIDTESRLKTKKTLEARYLQLLSKAVKVTEILEIEKELSTIREEIESKEGQLKYMQSQVSMSAIEMEFYKKSPAESGITQSYGSKMGNSLESGFVQLSSLFLWILNVWPFILILVVLFFLIRRRIKRKKA